MFAPGFPGFLTRPPKAERDLLGSRLQGSWREQKYHGIGQEFFRVTYKTRKFSSFCSLLQGEPWLRREPGPKVALGGQQDQEPLYRGAVNKRNRTEREQILHRRICSLSVRFLLFTAPSPEFPIPGRPPKAGEISLGLGSRALGGNRSIMGGNRTRIFRVTYKTRKFSNFCSLLQGEPWLRREPGPKVALGGQQDQEPLYRGAVNKRNRTEREQILHRRICSLSVRFLLFPAPPLSFLILTRPPKGWKRDLLGSRLQGSWREQKYHGKSDKNFQGHLQDSKIQQLLFPPSRRALASEGAWTQGRPRRPTGSGTPVPWSRKQEEPHGKRADST